MFLRLARACLNPDFSATWGTVHWCQLRQSGFGVAVLKLINWSSHKLLFYVHLPSLGVPVVSFDWWLPNNSQSVTKFIFPWVQLCVGARLCLPCSCGSFVPRCHQQCLLWGCSSATAWHCASAQGSAAPRLTFGTVGTAAALGKHGIILWEKPVGDEQGDSVQVMGEAEPFVQ